METEFEATFTDINKDQLRELLKKLGAKLVKAEFLQKRVVMSLPKGHEIEGGWLRVRDEGEKITLTLKIVNGDKIENQKEISLGITDFQQAVTLLETIGCHKRAYQESKRELWELGSTQITLDEWPFLEPFLEVEGRSEAEVKEVSLKLGLEYQKALFCSVDKLYSLKYNISTDVVNDQTPEITFAGPNPFAK